MGGVIKKGSWVQIHRIVLKTGERAEHLPEDTKNVPLEMWAKGFLNGDGNMGEEAEITTVTGRILSGTLVEAAPGYSHGFGRCIPVMLHIGPQLRKLLREGEQDVNR